MINVMIITIKWYKVFIKYLLKFLHIAYLSNFAITFDIS